LPNGAIPEVLGRIAALLPPLRRRAGHTVRFLHHRKGGRLLDVGCGNGAFLDVMRGLGWHVTGVEPDPKAAEVALKRGLEVHAGDIESAPLPEGEFDAITLSHVMEHFRDPPLVLAKLARALKPGGSLVSISPNPIGLLGRIFGPHWYGLDAPRHLVLPSPAGYRRMGEAAGLQVACRTSMHAVYWIFSESWSIWKHGAPGRGCPRMVAKLFAAAGSLLLPLWPGVGDEVVFIGVKR
jgi:SAM-dependent methyltransferase